MTMSGLVTVGVSAGIFLSSAVAWAGQTAQIPLPSPPTPTIEAQASSYGRIIGGAEACGVASPRTQLARTKATRAVGLRANGPDERKVASELFQKGIASGTQQIAQWGPAKEPACSTAITQFEDLERRLK
jgi:hypothetical protein